MNTREKRIFALVLTAVMAIVFLIGGASFSASAREAEPFDDRNASLNATTDSNTNASSMVNQSGEFELFGTVQAIETDTWTVEGLVITILPATEIKGTIQVGDRVKVHVFSFENGLAAREFELAAGASDDDASLPQQGDEIEFFGTIQAIGLDTWTISGLVIAILPGTEIKGSFQVGDAVKVHTFSTAEGLAAREIESALNADGRIFDDNSSDDTGDDNSGPGSHHGSGSEDDDTWEDDHSGDDDDDDNGSDGDN